MCQVLRKDKGSQGGACTNAQIFITIGDLVMMSKYTYSERSFFSLFNDTMVILIPSRSKSKIIEIFHGFFLTRIS